MNILMLSCSYGVPDFPCAEDPGDVRHTDKRKPGTATFNNHIEQHLTRGGNTVWNVSNNGASNLEVIQRANTLLDGNEVPEIPCRHDGYKIIQKPKDVNIDYVVWICTSVLRDHFSENTEGGTRNPQRIDVDVQTLDEHINIIQGNTYIEMQKLIQRIPDAKLIAIGGCGPIDESKLRKVLPVHYCVPDWRAELLGMEYTEHLSGGAKTNLNAVMSDPRLSDHLKMAQTVYDNMHQSDAFPDGCHPGAVAHKDLYDRISPVLQ